jgi:hypothetical protein
MQLNPKELTTQVAVADIIHSFHMEAMELILVLLVNSQLPIDFFHIIFRQILIGQSEMIAS